MDAKVVLRFLTVVILSSILPLATAAAQETDGRITFYTYYLKERQTVAYVDPSSKDQISRIFRSRDSNAVMPIDPRLLELIDRIEDHFQVRQVEVISGYRSSAFNKELKATGHNVANESFHTKGMAADLHLDEISEEALRDFALSLKVGGVGYYPSLDMVHVDVGPVRTWTEAGSRKSWIGEKNDAAPFTMTVTPTLQIDRKALPTLRVDGESRSNLNLQVEFFDNGKWEKAPEDLPFGKFRFKALVKGRPEVYQYSNEFYFKKI